MSAPKLEKTKTPGVYRRGGRYVVRYRHRGKQHKRFARTYDEARTLKATLVADMRRGEHRETSSVTFEDYAREWVETYTGRTNRGFRESTRVGYRRSIEQHAIPFFAARTATLAEIEPRDVRAFVAMLFELRSKPAASTVRGHVAAVKALLATAVEDGLLRHNPATGVRVTRPGAPVLEQDAVEQRRAMDTRELAALLDACPADWRLFFRLLAMTGVRIGEAVELRWSDVDLGAKRLRVRRSYYEGTVSEPKSSYGKRDIPLSTNLGRELWAIQGKPDELVFTSTRGQRVDQSNIWQRVLKPAATAAGVPWVGFHTFRHTCASMLFASGKNVKQVQVWLGHSDPGFTLRTYIHLVDDGLGDADFLDAAGWATGGPHEPRETGQTADPAIARKTA
ncbi:MAG TPA: site-specific integrase [Solirubrobacteraceae bacterium]|nr:site-specific integrase [Solirubrobacteraceae bacterium]